MNRSDLEAAVQEAEELASKLSGISGAVNSDHFQELCQKYVENQTKLTILQKIDLGTLMTDINQDVLNQAKQQRDDLVQQIQRLAQNDPSCTPEMLFSLLDQSKKALSDLDSLATDQPADDERIIRQAEASLREAEAKVKELEWFVAAYRKLSAFSGIDVLEDGGLKLFGEFTLHMSQQDIIIEPNQIFLKDIIDETKPMSVYLSEVIERVAAYRNLRDIANQLGWEFRTSLDAPIAQIGPRGSNSQAIFALIEYQNHPLIEWTGKPDLNIDSFNDSLQPLIDRIRSISQ